MQLWEMVLEPPLYHMDATTAGWTPSALRTPPTQFLQSAFLPTPLYPHAAPKAFYLNPTRNNNLIQCGHGSFTWERHGPLWGRHGSVSTHGDQDFCSGVDAFSDINLTIGDFRWSEFLSSLFLHEQNKGTPSWGTVVWYWKINFLSLA